MAFIVLTDNEAEAVTGISPTVGYSGIGPRATATGFVLNDTVLSDPANADVASFLSGLPTTETPTPSGGTANYDDAPVREFIPSVPVNEQLPTITGSATVGALLTANPGMWAGDPAPELTYQWQQGTTDIPGETGLTYTIQLSDVGETIRVRETGTNVVGGSVDAFSASTGVVVATGGALEDFTVVGSVSRGGLDTTYALVNAPQGTVIGDVVATVGTLSSVSFVDDAGGRFQLVGNQLQVGASQLDFEMVQGDPGAGHGKPYELITLRGTGPDAGTVDKQFKMAPEYAPIVATGGGDISGTVYNDTASLRAALNSENNPTEPRKIIAAPNTIFEVNGNSTTGINRSNVTFIGDFTSVTLKDRSFQIDGGTNIIIRGGVSAPGSDAAGANKNDRDSLRISHEGPLVDKVVIENFDWTLSTDELVSIISGVGKFARRVVLRYNALYHPMQDTGRPDGEDFHPMGLLIYNGQANIVVERNFFSGCAQRSPFMHKARGVLIQNNIICYRGNAGGYGGTQFSATTQGSAPNQESTAILRGNLYWPHPGSARERAIMFIKITDGTYIHVVEAGDPDSGTFPNHFFNPTTLDFSDDPILRSGIATLSGATLAGAIDWDPFKPADYGAIETDSAVKREAFFRSEFLKMGACKLDGNGDIIPGVHCKHLFDIKMALLTTGNYGGAANPTNIDNNYGVDWNVGGALGKINEEASQIVLP